MSTIYKTVQGDTFESVARKQYGDESQSFVVASANPGVIEDSLLAGTTLIIPNLPTTPQNLPQLAPSNSIDEVSMLIDGKRFRFWDSISLKSSLDSMSTVSFGAPFEPDLPGFKDAFRPFKYRELIVNIGGLPAFTGTMISSPPTAESNKSTVAVSGYSKPGVLNDCMASSKSYPLEFNGQDLTAITSQLILPFGLSAVFNYTAGSVFEQVANDPAGKILSFLTGLAKQRNLVIRDNEKGQIVYDRSLTNGVPVANLSQGVSPLESVVPSFSPQDYYSHVTGIEPSDSGIEGDSYTVKNPNLDVFRPFTFKVDDTNGGDLKSAVEAKAGRMFANAAAYRIKVATWRDSNGELWKPNTFVQLLAPNAMIYTAYKFIIRSVQLDATPTARTATLELIIPGTFSGVIPSTLPWD